MYKIRRVYSLKMQAKDNLINDWEIWFDDIARNVFGLPNTERKRSPR